MSVSVYMRRWRGTTSPRLAAAERDGGGRAGPLDDARISNLGLNRDSRSTDDEHTLMRAGKARTSRYADSGALARGNKLRFLCKVSRILFLVIRMTKDYNNT